MNKMSICFFFKLYTFAFLCHFATSIVTASPNFVFILTDDQDKILGGMKPLTKARKIFQKEGAEFTNMFVTSPLCCPSRSSILSGCYVHNHGVVNNSISGNCSSKYWQTNYENQTFVRYLKDSGYTTFFAGKYLNQYGVPATGGVLHVPKGWDHWLGLVGNSKYYNYSLSVNGIEEHHGNNPNADYLTDVLKKHWLLRQPKYPLPQEVIASIDETHRNRWRTLLSVDDGIINLYNTLKEKKFLNNTYIFLTSDNGFHLGQFSLPWDKRQLYEFDIRVPLFIRGPNVKPTTKIKAPVLNIDLAPTFLTLAGIKPPRMMDGFSFSQYFQFPSNKQKNRKFLIEHSGESTNKPIPQCHQFEPGEVHTCDVACICEDSWNNTYVCLRTISSMENTIYCHFKDNEEYIEFYNMTSDPYQLLNLYSVSYTTRYLFKEKDLEILSFCKGTSCHIT